MADYNKDFKRPNIELLSEKELEENSKSISGLWSLVGKVLNLVKKEGLTPDIVNQRDVVVGKINSFESSDHHQSFSIALMKDRIPK